MANARPDAIPAPLAFNLGYAGPRWLGGPRGSGREHEPQLRKALDQVAQALRARLPAHRPLCLVGALAQGADLAIAETLLGHGAVLRAWLPEPLDRFANESDFPDPRDRERIAALVSRADVAEVRAVSNSADRTERFVESAAQVVRETEAMLCVRHWDPEHQGGGTEQTLAFARALGRPVIEVRLQPDPAAAAVLLLPTWPELHGAWSLPFPRPVPGSVVADWKAAASAEAGHSKHFVVRAAAWTVALQLGVTVMAVLTLKSPEWDVTAVLTKLFVILVVAGIAIWSARRGGSARWAVLRFSAELHRSWTAVRGLRGPATWFEEDLPPEFEHHGRDLALLHGLDREGADLVAFRARYATARLEDQVAYAQGVAAAARRKRSMLTGIFHGCLLATITALLAKLVLHTNVDAEWASDLCSLVSVLGPAFGAAAVSFVALLDLTARGELHSRLLDFLRAQGQLLASCNDWAAVRHVVVATERRLLGEVKGWYARHAFRK